MCRCTGFMDCEFFMRYFLDIVGIIGFCDFVIFLNRHYYLILQFCFLCFQK